MDNTPDWDALSDTPPIAPVAQDRSTPMDSQVADFADEANRRVAAGEDAGTVEQDLQRKVTAAEPKTKAKASTDWDSLFDAPPRASELTSAYQPLESYQGQVYNSPSAALAQPDAYAAGSQVQGVGDYLENLGTEAAEKLRTAGAGIVQAVGEIPQMGRDIAAKFDTLTGGVQGGVPPSAVFTAAAQAQGAPADNTLAQAGAFESEKAAKAQEQAATHLVPAPDENTSGLDQAAYYAQQALVGAPTLAGAMAAGPVGGAALFGATTAGEQYAQKRLAGEAPVSAAASSGIEGAVSALTASLSLESALNPGAIGALKRIAETTGSVEAQSVINEATSIAAEQTIDGKDISADEIKQRLIDAAKGGLPAGVLMGGIGAYAARPSAEDAAAANVQRLAANLAPEAVRPTLEERVNAREIPQDQGGVPGQGIVEEGGREEGGQGVQRREGAGNAAGDEGQQVVDVDLSKFMSPAEVAKLEAAGLATDGRITNRADLVAATKIISADRAQEAPNVDQNVQPAGAERADQTQGETEVPQKAEVAREATDVETGRAVGADRTESAIAAGEEGVRLEPPGPLVTEAPEDEWLRVDPRKNPEAFGINRPAYPPLLEWVARAGGLNMDAFKSQYATDPAYLRDQKTNQKVVGKPLFRKNGGMTPDELRETMQQDGWLPPESPDQPAQLDNHDAFELFNRALGGKDVIHPADDNFEAMVRHVEEGQRQELEDRAVAQRLGYKNSDEMRAAHEADNRTATLYSRQQDLFGAPKELYEKAKAKRAENLDLFGGATTADAVDAAKRAKDLALRGGDTAVPMAAGEGELFAGPRPEQETLPEPPKYAQGPQTDNLTHDEAREIATRELKPSAMRKLEANGLNLRPASDLAQHASELTEAQRALVKGWTPADRSSANIVYDNLKEDEVVPTIIHEVWHANNDRVSKEGNFNGLADSVIARGRSGKSPEIKASMDRIPAGTPKSAYREEVLAQVMGDLYNQPVGRKIMDAFKLGLNRVGVPLDWMNAHEAAIRQIGIENLRHYAEAPRRAPAMTVQLAAPTAPAVAGQPRAEKPRIRVPVDQVPVTRTGGANDEQRGEAGGRGVPASDAGANAGAVREAGGQALPTEAGTRNAAATGVREPAVRTTGEGGVVREPTSIKNETVTAERAARDLGPIETHLGNDFGENNDQAKARLDANPSHGEELAAELAANPRPHTDVESAVLLRDRVRLQNEHADAMKRAETAMDSGDEQEHLRARATAAQIEARLQLNEEAAKHSGSATARGLNARRAMMNEDYSLARILTRARVLNGGDIAPEQRAIFEDLARRIAANDAVGPETPAKTARKARTPAEKRSLDDEFSSLAAELKKLTQPKASEALFARVEDPKVAAVLRKMAKNRSDAGETDPLKIVDALHDAVGENIPKEDIADTISGYGTTRKPTQDELTTRYNAIKRELADLSRTQDTLSGKIDPNAAKDRARQTALRTEIEGLDRRINYRDAVAPERTKPEYSAATQALKAKRDELAQEVRNLEPSPPATRPLDQNEVKNKAQRSALQREIDDLDRRIAAKQTEAIPRRPFTADAETKNLRALRDAKKRELENLKPSPAATKPEDPRVKRNDIRQKQLQREIADIKSRLQRKDYSRPERQKPVYDAKTTELAAQRAELARRVESELEKIRQQSKSKVERIVDLGLNIRRAVILSSVKTLGKLTGAATERIGFDPIEELAGGFLGHVPGLRGIAAGAPIEGRFSGHAVAEGLRHTFNAEARQAAMQKLKTGLDNLDLTFGNKRDYERSHTWLDYVGQLHGALKTPAKYNRFYSSLAKYAQWERARVIGEGMTPAQADAHMQDPVTIAMMGGKAYENANRSIFMQDNAAVTAYKVMLGYLSKAGAEGSMTRAFSKTAEKVGRYLVPIVRIPTNFVAESGSYGLGAAKALGQVIAAKGVENLTPDQKDYVMRNLKKQTVGAALMYLGYMGAGSIGGYYQQGDNKKTLKNAPGDITIGGVTVPRLLIHNPAMEMVQIGATIRRVAEARARKDEYPMASGALEAGKGLLSEVPFFDAPQRIGNAVTNIKTLGKYLGGEVRSSFIPPDVQNAARMLDNDKKRSPQNFTQELEMGVPGLRPNVPQTKTR